DPRQLPRVERRGEDGPDRPRVRPRAATPGRPEGPGDGPTPAGLPAAVRDLARPRPVTPPRPSPAAGPPGGTPAAGPAADLSPGPPAGLHCTPSSLTVTASGHHHRTRERGYQRWPNRRARA